MLAQFVVSARYKASHAEQAPRVDRPPLALRLHHSLPACHSGAAFEGSIPRVVSQHFETEEAMLSGVLKNYWEINGE
jgi:hypothetical protein